MFSIVQRIGNEYFKEGNEIRSELIENHFLIRRNLLEIFYPRIACDNKSKSNGNFYLVCNYGIIKHWETKASKIPLTAFVKLCDSAITQLFCESHRAGVFVGNEAKKSVWKRLNYSFIF